jgi:outer membrane protein assembly factor BamB/NAD(P)-dependent dehydrogenase (short-subunit alcohol dehydrogenase family)
VYHCARTFLPLLIASGDGVLVNTSSVNGLWAALGPGMPNTAYSAAKFAVRGFTEALIEDLRSNAPQVRVAVVMPGHVGTDIIGNTLRAHGKDPRQPRGRLRLRRAVPRAGAVMNRKACSIGGSLLLAAAWPSAAAAAAAAPRPHRPAPPRPGRRSPRAARSPRPESPPRAGRSRAPTWPTPRDVASAITSTNVSKLGVAWTVPLHTDLSHTDGAYATTPVIVNGVVYVQDLQSNVMAISLATGKVLWTHAYDSPNGGPDGVNVVGGVVYGATNHAAFALDAATGAQVWSRTVIGNDHEGIDMTPGYNHGTVYVSTVPVNPTVGEYLGGGKATLWALNAATGAPEWSWDEVQDLWGHPDINSGGGQWYAPSFDAQGNVYIGVANPAPLFGTKTYPLGSSRPGPDLYTDSVVKLSPHGKLLWYYQLTPHDLYDWDLQNNPVLTTANGRPVVVDGGKAGILFELDAKTGQLLWKLPVGRPRRARERRPAHRERQARLARRPARHVLPRAEHLRRHRDPAGQQRLDHVRRRQRPRTAGVQDRLHRGGGRRPGGRREGHRRDGRGQPGHRRGRMGHPAPVLAVRRGHGDQRCRLHHHVPR